MLLLLIDLARKLNLFDHKYKILRIASIFTTFIVDFKHVPHVARK